MTTRPHVSGINSITILWRKFLLFHCACFSCMDGMGAYAPGRAFLESFRLCTGSSRAVFRCERAMQNGALYFCGLPCSQIPNLTSFALGFGISRFATSRFFRFRLAVGFIPDATRTFSLRDRYKARRIDFLVCWAVYRRRTAVNSILIFVFLLW